MVPVNAQVGDLIDMLYQRRESRLELKAQLETMEAEENAIRQQIITMLGDASLEGAKGSTATASITRRVVANVTDWDKFYQYVAENNAFELLHRRVSDTAYRDRLEQGVEVPGTQPFTVTGLSLQKAHRNS